MHKKTYIFAALLLCFAFNSAAFAQNAASVDFRVNNKVMKENQEVIAHGKTLFCEGMIFDFLESIDEVAVFEPQKSTFCILDLKTRKKLIVSAQDIDSNFENLRQWGLTHSNDRVKAFFNPEFKINYRKKEKQYDFVSDVLTYRVSPMRAEDTNILGQYRYFARWSCKLNLLTTGPGARTLFARMKVNDAIFNAGSLIERLELTITPQSTRGITPRQIVLYSEYQYLPRLVASDLAAVQQIKEFMEIFPEMTLDEYQQRFEK